MTSLEEVLSKAVKDSASDIFIVAGGYLSYKVDGEIRSMDESMKLTPTETSYFIDEIYSRRSIICSREMMIFPLL